MERQKITAGKVRRLEMQFDADPLNLDADGGMQGCNGGGSCPDIAYDPDAGVMKLISKTHDFVDFPVHVYNAFIRKAKSGKIKALDPSLSGGEHYRIGGLAFTADKAANRVVVTGEDGKQADIAVKHFNRFVDAAKDGRMAELRPFARK